MAEHMRIDYGASLSQLAEAPGIPFDKVTSEGGVAVATKNTEKRLGLAKLLSRVAGIEISASAAIDGLRFLHGVSCPQIKRCPIILSCDRLNIYYPG